MAEVDVEQLGEQLRSLLRPGMTAAAVGGDTTDVARLMAKLVGPGGRVVEVGPVKAVGLDDELAARVDLILTKFSPQRLREAETDPVSVLDDYRAVGFRISGAVEDLPEDPGELVRAVDAGGHSFAILRLDPIAAPPPARERMLPTSRRLGRKWARRFPPTVEAGTLAYDATQRALVASVLDEEAWRRLFARGAKLPPGLGAGFDERVVEYGWLFSRGLSGRVLDAGSVLNHRHLVERLQPSIDDLTIVTLAPEPTSLNSLGVSYLYADLRRLPLRDDWFDEVVCLSTIEHVGMDNAVYGASAERSEDPGEDAARALRELLRVVRPGGRVHLSVPFGHREDHGWFRQLDAADVEDLLRRAGIERPPDEVFLHTPRGWQRATAAQAADARYNDAEVRATDLAVAARAVLCLTITA